MTIFDLADILIVAIFIYIFLLWLKQTRSHSIIIGMIVLGLVYLFASVFDLNMTLFIFRAFFSVFIIALVIIFQAEIRRFFEVIGLWGIRRRFKRNKSFGSQIAIVNIVVRAVDSLAGKHMGALIVIRGNEPIERYLNGGILMNAQPSAELLESIFDDNSPGHDGAVIIENDIITKFAVHLPLSHDLTQTEHKGTRHAAALGLAERGDAAVIVVSEENGDISLAHGGKIEREEDLEKLRGALESFYKEKYSVDRWHSWENVIKKNFLEKLISFPLAFLMWYLFVN